MSQLSTFYSPLTATSLGLGNSANVTFGSVTAGSIQNTPIGNTTPAAGTFTTLNATNGTITASAPVLDLSQTWNNAAVTFTGLRFNATDTASASGSLLADLRVGGSSRVSVNKNGTILASGVSNYVALACDPNFINLDIAAGTTVASSGIATRVRLAGRGATGLVQLFALNGTEFRADDNAAAGGVGARLIADAADTLAQRRGANPQTFRIYNTFTDASNHERGFMRWSSNVLQIGTEKAGTGSARALEFQTDGATRLTIGSAGGAVFAAGSATVPSISFSGSAVGFYQRGVNEIAFTDGNEAQMRMYVNTCIFNSDFVIGWGNSTSGPTGLDTILRRDAAGTIAQLNAGNAQAYRLYNTWSGGNSWERLNLRWASNEFIIDAEAGSSGGTLRGIKIGSATSSLLGFYGVTPVDQPATVADPAGGGTVDTEARTAINAIIDRLQELGLIA